MKQTTLRKLKDQAKFKLSKRSKIIYTKQTIWRRAGGLLAIVFTADISGRTYKRVGSVKVWPAVFIATGSTGARKKNKSC